MEIKNFKKLRSLIRVCWATLIIVWLFCFISGEKLNVVIHNERLIEIGNFIDNNIVIKNILSLITYYLNMILLSYAILKQKLFRYKPIIISLFIIIVWVLKSIFMYESFVVFLDFSYILLIIILDRKKWLRGICGLALAFSFSFLATTTKTYNNIYVGDLPFIIATVMMIDNYIMCFIYYLYSRKEKNNDDSMGNVLFKGKTLENCNSYFRNFISSCSSRYRNFSSYLKSNAYTVYCAIIFFIITYGSILIASSFFDMMVEAAISMLAFHIFRHYDENTFHAKTSVKCWIVSLISFLILLKLSLPIKQSIFVSIMLSYLLTKVMYYVQEYIDIKLRDKNVVVLKPLKEYTIEELKSEFKDIEECYIKAVYEYIHRDKYNTCERIVQKYHLSRATLYRVIDKVKQKIK